MSESASQHVTPAGVIDLERGDPSEAFLPAAAVADALQDLRRVGPALLQYGTEAGDPGFRRELAAFLGDAEAAPVEHWFVTAGATAALDLLAGYLGEPGRTVLTAAPSYHLALPLLRDRGLRPLGVPGDRDGPDPDAWERALARHRPAFAYLVPIFGNPTGRTLPRKRAAALSNACERHGVPLVADEVYRPLAFGGEAIASLAAAASAATYALGSVSKFLGPGLRVGWIRGPAGTAERLAGRGVALSGGGTNPFTAAVVQRLIRTGALQANLQAVRAELRARHDALVAALHQHLPDAEFDPVQGGYFLWLRVPGVPVGKENGPVAQALTSERLAVSPGERFLPELAEAGSDPNLSEHLRLAFGHEPSERLREGAERLARALRRTA